MCVLIGGLIGGFVGGGLGMWLWILCKSILLICLLIFFSKVIFIFMDKNGLNNFFLKLLGLIVLFIILVRDLKELGVILFIVLLLNWKRVDIVVYILVILKGGGIS